MRRFKQLFKTKKPAFMGIDITANRIALLEIDGEPGAFRVLSYASATLPPGAVVDNQIADAEAVATALARAIERSGSRTRRGAIAVCGPAVFSKIIDMPADLEDAELEQQISFDAEQYIPDAIEEVSLDFQVLERDTANADVNRVLLVACRRDNIEIRTAALEMAGMTVQLVDVEDYALQNACTLLVEQDGTPDSHTSIAVFDIGDQQTRLSVQNEGRSVYSREMSFGIGAMVERLAATHELDDTEQLRTRLRTGEIDAEGIAGEVGDFAQRAASQIERALQFYVSAAVQDETIDRILLVGTAALLPGFEAALQTHLDWPVRTGNPLAGMLASSAARRNHVEAEGPTLMIAAGLALRSVR